MPVTSTLKKQVAPLGKLAIWAGTYLLSNNDAIAGMLTQAGIDATLVETVKGFIGEIAPSEIWDSYKGLAVNDDLANAFADAIDATTTALAHQFKPDRSLDAYQTQQLARFFPSLGHQLKKADFSAERVRQYAEEPRAFFAELWQIHSPDAAEPDIPDAVLDQLFAFTVSRFDAQFRLSLINALHTNNKAQTAYVVSLLEWAAQANVQNAERIVQISDVLACLTQRQEEQAHLLQQVAHIQGLIHQQLQKAAVDFRHFVSYTEAFQTRLNAQLEPALTLPNLAARQGHEFNFKSQYTTFIGRDVELAALWTFVAAQPERRFMWWMVTGPGGMGKSRLALELCQQARYLGKHVGFLERRDGKNFRWSQWRPQVPTLLVIDYVATDADAVQNLLGELSRSDQSKNLSASVRVLLLEREVVNDDWWASWRNDDDLAHSHYYQNEPERLLALPPFDPGDHWRIIRNVHERQKKPLLADEDTTLIKLAELDPKGRPLFAFLVGRALAEGNDISQWNVNNLLDNLLQREEARVWETHPTYATHGEGHKNLLLIATLTRGLWFETIEQLYAENLPGLPPNVDNSLYERMAHIYKFRLYEGLQPDLIGGYFVLKHLQKLQRRLPNGKKTAQALLQAAWTSDASETWWMVYQIFRDYAALCTGITHSLLSNARPLPDAPVEDWLEWAKLCVNLTYCYGRQGSCEQAEERYNALNQLCTQFSNNPQIALTKANGAINLINDYSRQGLFEQSKEKYNDLNQLCTQFSKDPLIALAKARGAVNLLARYGKQGLFEQAEETYNDLNGLCIQFSDEPQIALEKAKGAVNLITYYGGQELFGQAEEKYNDLDQLCTQFPYDPQISLKKASGAVNLTNYYGNRELFEQAEDKYKQLAHLADRFPDNPQIILIKAYGAVNLTSDYGRHGLFEQGKEKYNDLNQLCIQFSKDSKIALAKAKGIFNLLIHYGTQELFEQAEEKYNDLNQLCTQFYKDPLIALEKAKGSLNLLTYYSINRLFIQAEAKYADLEQLYAQFLHDPQIALTKALGVGALLSSSRAKPEQVPREQLLEDLVYLLSQYHTHPEWQEKLPLLKRILQIELGGEE